ncbi:MAG: hypothetical protein FWG07_00095 [Treponema sp.]|nr:hypothetical protein [Treponema sp.]
MTELGPWSNTPFEELNTYERYICQGHIGCCISVVPIMKNGNDVIYNDMFAKLFVFAKNGSLEKGIYKEISVKEFHENNMLDELLKNGWKRI